MYFCVLFQQNADSLIQALLPDKFKGASIELAAYLKGLFLNNKSTFQSVYSTARKYWCISTQRNLIRRHFVFLEFAAVGRKLQPR